MQHNSSITRGKKGEVKPETLISSTIYTILLSMGGAANILSFFMVIKSSKLYCRCFDLYCTWNKANATSELLPYSGFQMSRFSQHCNQIPLQYKYSHIILKIFIHKSLYLYIITFYLRIYHHL